VVESRRLLDGEVLRHKAIAGCSSFAVVCHGVEKARLFIDGEKKLGFGVAEFYTPEGVGVGAGGAFSAAPQVS
jgi:hypothetical protein